MSRKFLTLDQKIRRAWNRNNLGAVSSDTIFLVAVLCVIAAVICGYLNLALDVLNGR